MAVAAYRHIRQDTRIWHRCFHRGPGIARLSCRGHHCLHVYWLPYVVPRFLLCLLALCEDIVTDQALLLQSTASSVRGKLRVSHDPIEVSSFFLLASSAP